MKAAEIRDMDAEQLLHQLHQARGELFNLRFQHATGELENTSKLRLARRDVARLMTAARQRGLDTTNVHGE